MEYNAFRDYCKAENSEDEEMNHDLQSRLYAEIYYSSNDTKNVDTKSNIKLEDINSDDKTLHKDINNSQISDIRIKNDPDKKTCPINESANNSILVEKDNKPDIASICITNEVNQSLCEDINNKNNSDISHVKTLKEENVESLKDNEQVITCHKIEHDENNSDYQNIHNIEKDINIRPKSENEIKEELKPLQCLNNEAIANQDTLHSTKDNIENNNEKCHEIINNEAKIDDIFKKYEFSKSFINNLYLKKYENLKKRLQEIEEEKQKSLRENERVKENKENQRQIIIEQDLREKSMNDVEANTKYEILSRSDKLQKKANYSEEITLLSSDTESDSEESILEVPIPPKPQPPVINLQDSDENSETSSDNSDIDEEASFIIEKKNDLVRNTKKKTVVIDQNSDNSNSVIDFIDDTPTIENIVLNCTEIQKGASSIKEIMEMSKIVQSDQHFNKDTNSCEKHNSSNEKEIYIKDFNNSDDLFISNNDKDNKSNFPLPSKTIDDKNVMYERDKKELNNFAKDVMVSNFLNSKELTSNRKRHHENDDEPSTSESKRSKLSCEEDSNKDKTNEDSWAEYFFRPMSQDLKAFYDFQGQENFDIGEIQSKMSKDPRLWAILDEDLMPNLLKNKRYWNMKCTNCHQPGHQKHNCPEPYKPLRCYMCGIQGHIETRCPQKMCLTCGRKQNTFRKTCESCVVLYCNTCNAIGHESTECPDLWRRFHQTTRTSEINIPQNLSEVMKPADLLYCCNCTKRGHDSSTCNEYRWSQHFPTPAFVSDYTGKPEEKSSQSEQTTNQISVRENEDIIPLTNKKNKCMIFLEGKDDLENSFVVYSYGKFYTKKPNGEEIKRKLLGEQIQPSHITNLLKGRVSPHFLDELIKIIQFEIKIYYNSNKELMLRVRTIANTAVNIIKIFIFWLKLNDEDKSLKMHINLPRNRKKLLKFLIQEIGEIKRNLKDPNHLCTEIDQLKKSMIEIQDSAISISTSKKIISLRSELLKVFHTLPNYNQLFKKLKKMIRCLDRSSNNDVSIGIYLHIIVIYNQIFVPRALTDIELKRLLKVHYKYKEKQFKNEKKKIQTKKQKDKKLSSYESFIESLQKFNSKKTCNITKNSDACSSKNIEIKDKQVPTILSVENILINKMQTYNTENISVKIHNVGNNITESTDKPIQLPHNQDISNNNEITNPIQKSDLKIISSNLIPITLQKSICTNVTSRTSKNVPCAKIKPSGNTEKNLDIMNSNNEKVKTSNLQQQDNIIDSEINILKKKKTKKAKKAKLDLENNSDIIEDQVVNVGTSIENKANEIINEALEFNVPYMNKAVEEIKKRINDKNLKQEHIDTLIRLVNLEKDHRKYVSSFCNYLQ